MSTSFRLGKIYGIPFYLHYTWFLILALVVISLSQEYFPALYPGWPSHLHWVTGAVASLLFFASLLAHELSHSLVSLHYGIPVRSITLFIFGGVARISREAGSPKEELLMAAAGPLTSLFLGGLFLGMEYIISSLNEPLAALFSWLMQVNFLLAAFNLIPGFPLDGGRIFRALIWKLTGRYKTATNIAAMLGQLISWMFILGGVFLALFTLNWLSGLWLVFIGFFLLHAVSLSKRHSLLQERLAGITAENVMNRHIVSVPFQLTLGDLIRDYMDVIRAGPLLVVDGERIRGIITASNIRSVPERLWAITPVIAVMTPIARFSAAYPQEDILSLWEKLEASRLKVLPVLHEGRVLGLITREDLRRFLG